MQGAIQWLEDNQNKSIEDIQADEASKAEDDDDAETKAKIAELETGQAKSLVCNDCGKRFKNEDLASFHAAKTYALVRPPLEAEKCNANLFNSQHTDFSQSTEEIAPLSEEEKAIRLQELREKLQAKRALQSVKDKEDHKRNEVTGDDTA